MQGEKPADLSSVEGTAPMLLSPVLSVCLSTLLLPSFFYLFIYFILLFVVILWIEARASQMQDTHPTTEYSPSP